MALTSKQRKYLKGLAHNLDPLVQVGQNGVSENVAKEIERALELRELIKIRVACEDSEEMSDLTDAIVAGRRAELVQIIGHTVILYRRNPELKNPIKLPS